MDPAVARVIAGDAAAFQQIVDATSAKLVRLSARMMGSLADGEDVLQEAYVKAYRGIVGGQFDGRSSLETWLYRIVTNTAIDALRARVRRPRPRDGLAELAWDGAASVEARIALTELEDWLGSLPAEQRVAITLKGVEGLHSAEIADAMRISEGAVEQLLVRARTTLRRKRKDADDGSG